MSTAATSTRPPGSSWTSHSAPDRPRQRPSTTPHGLPARTPGCTGQPQPVPPLLSPNAQTPRISQVPRTPSPNYFGFIVDASNDPPGSNPGNHAKKNWDFPSSTIRDTAVPTPRTVPVEQQPEYELFRRQSDLNKFNLSSHNLANFNNKSRSSNSDHHPQPPSPQAARPFHQLDNDEPMDLSNEPTHEKTSSAFDLPRHESPANLSPSQHPPSAASHSIELQDRVTRLSLPNRSDSTSRDNRLPQRAETLPASVDTGSPKMLQVQEFADYLRQLPDEILLLDLRVYPQFSQSRIKGALNLCIPTTLLKRPSFNLQKLADTFTDDANKRVFESWKGKKHIMVYDANSLQLKDAASCVNVLKKFLSAGYHGHTSIIKGGFMEFSKKYPSLVDMGQSNVQATKTKSPLSIAPPGPGAAPVAGGCPMPATKSAANPFFGNIRQNMDLIGGVGQISIKHPPNMPETMEARLPSWLRKAVDNVNKGKDVADKFLEIEKAEQGRMQAALTGNVSYGSPRPQEEAGSVQIAGIEKGAKNRYNNILPYDHSRVKLQDVPKGSCDYINASYVKSAYSHKRYIATQAPVPATFNDFWRVIWEQDVRVIVMLTAESEGGQVKCHSYWKPGDYGPLKLKNISEKRVSLENNRSPYPNTALVKRPSLGQRRSTNPHTMAEKTQAAEPKSPATETPFVFVRKFTLAHTSFPFQPMREITQLQYSNWPDFGAPAHPAHLLGIIEQTDKIVKSTQSPTTPAVSDEAEPAGQRPLLVHCSAGCGRTGTFCTVDSVIDMLKRQRSEREASFNGRMDIDSEDDWIHRDDIDLIAKAVTDFRLQRLSMVQSLRQFVLCYESILEWFTTSQKAGMKAFSKERDRRSYQG